MMPPSPAFHRGKRLGRAMLIAGGLAWSVSLLVDVTRFGDDLTVSLREGAVKFYWGEPEDYPGARNAVISNRDIWPVDSYSHLDPFDSSHKWDLNSGVLLRLGTVEIDPWDCKTIGTFFGIGLPRYLSGFENGGCFAIPAWFPFASLWAWLWWRRRPRKQRVATFTSSTIVRFVRRVTWPFSILCIISIVYEFEYYGSRLSFGLGRGMIRAAWDGTADYESNYLTRTFWFGDFQPWPRYQGDTELMFSGSWPNPGFLFVSDPISKAIWYSRDARNERISLWGFQRPMVRFAASQAGVYIPIVPVGVLLIAAWFIQRRRTVPRLGHCLSCGYDLTGNVSGRCPECGVVVANVNPPA